MLKNNYSLPLQDADNLLSKNTQENDNPAAKNVQKNDNPAAKNVQKNNNPAVKNVQKNDNPAVKNVQKNNNPTAKNVQKNDNPAVKNVQKNDNSVARIAARGLLLALAMVFGYVETLIPISLGVPGVKLGLANLVTIVGLYVIGIPQTIELTLLRILLTGFTFGNVFSMLYSLAGAALSLLLMFFGKKSGWFTAVGVSIIGGVGHNIGQLAVAAFVVHTLGVFSYLPVLLAAGTVAGAIIGLLGGIIIGRIGKFIRF